MSAPVSPAGPFGQPGQAGSTSSRTAGGVPPVLDLAFDSGTLHILRAEVRARARQAGLSEDRAGDVVVAVHELAANSVSHAGGKGGCEYGIWPGHCTARLTMAIPMPPATGRPR